MSEPTVTKSKNDAVRGVIRSAVQVFVSAVLAYGPVAAVLDAIGLELTEGQVTAFLVPIVMGAYWYVGNFVQHMPAVQTNPVFRWVAAILMGGFDPPGYGDPAAAYSIVNPDGTEISLVDYIDDQFGQ